jgi:hypothetical protein
MKYLSLFLTVTALFAADINAPGRVEYFTPAVDVNPDFIGFSNGYAIDTRVGEPNLPADLRIDGYDGAGYYLLQVKGPVYSEWLTALKAQGIDVIVYIPNYSFIVYADPDQINQARAKDFVKWTGIYQPAYKLEKELLNARGTARVVLQLFPRANVEAVRRIIESQGCQVVLTTDHELCKTIDAVVDLGNISALARVPDVQWIQRWSEPTICNANAQWVVQTGYKASAPTVDSVGRRVWFKGVRGQGTVISTSDTGIYTAHYAFYDAAYPITAPGVFPNHRKIVGYKVYSGAAFGDLGGAGYWHGTHTAGTTAGNDTVLGANANDGQAKEAREYFCDLADASGGFVIGNNLTPMYDTIYLGRGLPYHILQHSGSWGWGNTSGTYLIMDATTDAYAYKYPDFLSLYAAGNESSARTLRNPGIAKNVLTIGACGNGTSSNTIAYFSSRGPTADNRIKPNICAPGVAVVSAQGGTTHTYWSMDGTSMATPNSNGAVDLIRCYLRSGYYPTGAANPPDSIRYISAGLLRAMTMVSADPNIGSFVPPSFDMGWGRIDIDSVLYFVGDSRHLIIKDDTNGVTTGQSKIDSFNVNSAIPLRICVAWIDTAAAANAARTLINNINVLLTSPGGTTYHGNLYTTGQSTANPTAWDSLNVEECFRVNAPATGHWRLTVSGQTIPNGPMGFAYAITGDVSPITGIEENTSAAVPIEKVIFNPITNGRILLRVSLTAKGRVEARLIDLTGRIVETITRTDLPAGESILDLRSQLPSGVYFLEVKTSSAHKIGKLLIVR